MRFGYLVPEFPGQTHAFFWREVTALEEAGVSVDLISTRPPAAAVASHSWTPTAVARTCYLTKPGLSGAWSAGKILVRAAATTRLRSAVRDLRSGPESAPQKLRILAAAAILGGRARRAGWRHVHVHSCGTSAHIALVAHQLTGLTYSLTLHGPLADYGPRQDEKWRNAAFVLVITEQLARQARAELGDAVPQRTAIAPMGVRLDEMARSGPYQAWDGHGDVVLFSCGRLNPAKGHDTVIRAVAALRDGGIPAVLTIAGEDELGGSGYRVELEALIDSAGLHGSVHLIGAVDETAVRSELQRAHQFVLASHGEPLGVAIMEAMAMTTPVVVGDGGGVRELVDADSAVLVDPEDAAAVAAGIRDLAEDPPRARRLAHNGRTRVEARFDSGRSADILREQVALTG